MFGLVVTAFSIISIQGVSETSAFLQEGNRERKNKQLPMVCIVKSKKLKSQSCCVECYNSFKDVAQQLFLPLEMFTLTLFRGFWL